MKEIRKVQVRQLVDWKAAWIAGLLGGFISLITNILISAYLLNSPFLFIRIISSVILGQEVIPSEEFSWIVLITGFGIHLLLSTLFSCLIAAVVHKWGILISFVGGALMGLAFYAINFYAISILFPWFYAFRSWIFLVMHILYGAFAGSIYELIEVERYEEIDKGRA